MKFLLILTASCSIVLLVCWLFLTLAEKTRGRFRKAEEKSGGKILPYSQQDYAGDNGNTHCSISKIEGTASAVTFSKSGTYPVKENFF